MPMQVRTWVIPKKKRGGLNSNSMPDLKLKLTLYTPFQATKMGARYESKPHMVKAVSKWITVENGGCSPIKLKVSPQGTALMEALGSDHLKLITIWGRARTGKSFLMNLLSGQAGAFKVKPGNIPCTLGVDALTSFPTYEEFLGIPPAATRSLGRIGFLDAEGQGDKGIDYDTILTAPLLLVSKVTIFNWMGSVAKDELLQKLGVLADAARKIQIGEVAKSRREYRIFGHLHIILRDQPNVDDVQQYLLEEEDGPATDEAAEVRNKIRKIIKQSFASCHIWGFPSPIESSSALNAGAFNEQDVSPR